MFYPTFKMGNIKCCILYVELANAASRFHSLTAEMQEVIMVLQA
jgi:hypothetical protein